MIPRRFLIRFWRSFLPPIILAVSLLSVYLATIAPGLTWANGGSDGGDLITATATRGVPHPTGYPLYVLLARLFQFVPVGSLAFRTNLMSAIFTVLASVLIYRTVMHNLTPVRTIPTTLAGMAAGYCFGLAPLIWSQAVITEVYALQAFLVILIITLYSHSTLDSHPKLKTVDRWRGLTLGLALGNHITSLLIVPVALLLGATRSAVTKDISPSIERQPWFENYKFDLPSLGRQLPWLGAGLSLYLILPLRALAHPPINWGNPVSLERLWWLVTGKLYQNIYLNFEISHIWLQIQARMYFTLMQLGIIVILLGLLGLFTSGNSSRLVILTLWASTSSLVFVSFYRSADADVYLIPLLISFAIWLGLGIGRLAERLSQRSHTVGLGLCILLVGIVLIHPASYIRQVDASQDRRAESFGQEVLSTVPENAIVFAQGDRAIFTLWYFHFALHERADLTLLATELLHYDWYQEVVRSTYPSLSLPGSFPYPETITRANPQHAICHVQYTDRAEIECANPLKPESHDVPNSEKPSPRHDPLRRGS